jgi:aminoglycoside 6'-N-acetyltransferase
LKILLSFRSLDRSDFPLLQRWLSEPHVDAWWHQTLDLHGLEDKYGPRIDRTEPTHVYVIAHGLRPIGWIQWYLWSDYPDHAAQLGAGPQTAGMDLAIGEPEMIGSGLGPIVIRAFIQRFIRADRSVSSVITDIDERNTRSLRAFEKVGFSFGNTVRLRGEDFQRRIMSLELSALDSLEQTAS